MIEQKDNSILWNGVEISFFQKTLNQDQYFSSDDIEVEKTGCGWQCKISCTGNPSLVGVMIPIGGLEVTVCDTPIEMYKSKQYYYAPARELERILILNIKDVNIIESPIIHIVSGVTSSWSCPNECLISTFVSNYRWYINIVAATWNDVTFFLDESSNFLINMQRYPPTPKEVLINRTTSIHTMGKALLAGSTPRQHPNQPNVIQKTRQIQKELSYHNVESVIIGSLACRLNSIPIDVNDIDLMVTKQQLHRAIDIVGTFADSTVIKDDSDISQDHIELCYDNYNILHGKNNVVHKNELTYLNNEGLIWLYMINLFACNIDEHADDYKSHILNAICSLQSSQNPNEFMPENYSRACFRLCEQLSAASIKYNDIRINKPFTIRSFRQDSIRLYPIVNLGSCCGAEVAIDFIPTKAKWKDIKGRAIPASIVPCGNFSLIHIPDIDVPGVLECY